MHHGFIIIHEYRLLRVLCREMSADVSPMGKSHVCRLVVVGSQQSMLP